MGLTLYQLAYQYQTSQIGPVLANQVAALNVMTFALTWQFMETDGTPIDGACSSILYILAQRPTPARTQI